MFEDPVKKVFAKSSHSSHLQTEKASEKLKPTLIYLNALNIIDFRVS